MTEEDNKKKSFWNYIEEAFNYMPKLRGKVLADINGMLCYLEPDPDCINLSKEEVEP